MSLLGIGAASCAGTRASCPEPTAGNSAAAGASTAPQSGRLGMLDGTAITDRDLSDTVHKRLSDIENEAAQRRLHMTWAGVEEVIADRLMTKEAARRGMSVDDLRDQEIGSKVTPPTDDEVRRTFEEAFAGSNVSFEAAAPHIRSELMTQRLATEERAFIDQLRQNAKVEYSIPVPELPRQKIEIGDGASYGPKDAKVTIVEFSDFQCPYCSRAAKILHELRSLYPNKLRIEHRDFPLQQHPQAQKAAEAGRCALEQNKFWEYYDVLFTNSHALEPTDLLRYAEQTSLDMAAFQSCIASDRPAKAVRESLQLGARAGIEGTPAIYINGVKLIGLLPLPLMQALIDHELAATN